MPRPVPDLLEELEGELAATERQLEVFRFQVDEVTASLQSLADERVAAFVELAAHYLPELSFHTLQDAWTEVREQIHEILLRQEDDCRQLTRQLQECSQQQHQYTQRRHDLSAQLEKSRRDLLSKRGNARKLLAEDDAIGHVDVEAVGSTSTPRSG